MARPILEMIISKMATALEGITVANGYQVTVNEVYRPLTLGGRYRATPGQYDVQLTLGDEEPYPDLDMSGATPVIGLEQPVQLDLLYRASDYATTPIEQVLNTFRSDVTRAIMADPQWAGYAIDTQMGNPQSWIDRDSGEGGSSEVVTLRYRIKENDPYTLWYTPPAYTGIIDGGGAATDDYTAIINAGGFTLTVSGSTGLDPVLTGGEGIIWRGPGGHAATGATPSPALDAAGQWLVDMYSPAAVTGMDVAADTVTAIGSLSNLLNLATLAAADNAALTVDDLVDAIYDTRATRVAMTVDVSGTCPAVSSASFTKIAELVASYGHAWTYNMGVPVNTVAPVASGTGTVGETLTTTDGTWDNAPDSYAYQWSSDGTPISGATASTFELTASEAGADVLCAVTATNAGGESDPADSNAIAVAVPVPVNTVAPVASGTGASGETLSTTNGTWDNNPDSYAYQWERDGTPISGATSDTYLLVSADVSTDVSCVVIATNEAGDSDPAESNAITVADPFADAFIFTVKTDSLGPSDNNQFRIPLKSGEIYDFTARYDGQETAHNTDSDLTLTFPSGVGTYNVEIAGTFPAIYFNNQSSSVVDKQKVVGITSFGNVGWLTDWSGFFYGCSQIETTLPVFPDGITSLYRTFRGGSKIIGPLPDMSNLDGTLTTVEEFLTDCSLITGQSQKFWLWDNEPNVKARCYEDNTSLTDYATIPAAYGGGGA